MTSSEAYEGFLIEFNRNDINSNINVSKGKFVLIYNKEAKKWLKEKLKRKLSTEEHDELSDLLVDNAELTSLQKHLNHVDFELPEDFYSLASATTLVSKQSCERLLDAWNVKPQNIQVLLRDENHKPSFDYEETILTIASKKVKVFYDGFKVKKLYFNYYRFPENIDIEGYIKLDGTPSINIDPELSDLAVGEIISRCALEATRNTENAEAFPFAKERINSEE